MAWLKANLFSIIAGVVLAAFAGVWLLIMKEVFDFTATTEDPVVKLAPGVVSAAGLLGTTISTLTASALGFTIADVRAKALANPDTVTFDTKTVGANISNATLMAVLIYLAVSLGAFFTWVLNDPVSPEVLSVYALSSLGWLVGSAGMAFKTTTS